jgi:ZIP family zinc transporter
MPAFNSLHPVLQALLAGSLTWALTAIGAAAIFTTRQVSRRALDAMLGFASGVMIAASYWSLLAPAIELSQEHAIAPWFPPAVGFLTGGFFLAGLDKLLPHLHPDLPREKAEGIRTPWRRTALLVLAITLHNFPEGLAVGVAFGAAAAGIPSVSVSGALALAVGIGIQNIPEGLAVAAPLRREGVSRLKSFWYGQLSATVEPIAAVLGVAAVVAMRPLLPYALSFAAGAMIFVVVEELIPESHRGGSADLVTIGAMLGFVVMMILDLAFA